VRVIRRTQVSTNETWAPGRATDSVRREANRGLRGKTRTLCKDRKGCGTRGFHVSRVHLEPAREIPEAALKTAALHSIRWSIHVLGGAEFLSVISIGASLHVLIRLQARLLL